ncbi:hypothetical protein DYZ93_01203 [Listeria monocytogenes]|nr:hypothetical protein DYZ93_01203 [Listeria monocytogenes]
MRTLKFLQKHLMTATSYMIPFVVAGGYCLRYPLC